MRTTIVHLYDRRTEGNCYLEQKLVEESTTKERPRALQPDSACGMAEEEEGVDIKTLSPQHLQSLGESIQQELQTLGESFQKLQGAVSRFHQSGVALEALAEQPEGACASGRHAARASARGVC